MATITVTTAIAVVRRLLDDAGANQRYNDSTVFFNLQTALTMCLSDYISAGGDAFDVEVSVSTVAGLATLTGPLLLVRGVQVSNNGTSFYTVEAQSRTDRRYIDSGVQTLRVVQVTDYRLPEDLDDPLIGIDAVAANSWFAFDQWVITNAALMCGIADNDKRPGLEALEKRFRDSVMARCNTPKGRPLPDSEGMSWWHRLGYVFQADPTAPTIQLVQRDTWL